MTNLNTPRNTKRVILDIFKWLLAVFFILGGIITIFSSSFIGGLLIIIGGGLLAPVVTERFKQKLSLWQHRPIRLIGTIGIIFFGMVLSAPKSGNTPTDKHNEAIRKYVEANKDKPFLKNLQLLEEWSNVFEPVKSGGRVYYYSDRYSEAYTPLDTLKDGSVRYGLFLDNKQDKTISTEKYIKSVPNYGQLKKYFVVFTVNKKNEVVKAIGMFENNKNEIKEIDDTNFDLSKFANLSLIKTQIAKAEKESEKLRKEEAEEQYQEDLAVKKSKWEESCISSYDGSCTKLRVEFKHHLKDPSSFEHIETHFQKKEDYVLVVMSYRAKNSFGALDIGTVTAKVDYDCEVLEISE